MAISDSKGKRAVVWANKSQVLSLNYAFSLNSRPEKSVLEELAREVGLDSKWIARWFIRKRRDARNALAKLAAADFESSRLLESQNAFSDNHHSYVSLTNNALKVNSDPRAQSLETSQCIHGPLCSWCQFDPPHSNVFACLGFSCDSDPSTQFANINSYAANSVKLFPDRDGGNHATASSKSDLKVPSLTFGYIPLAFPAVTVPQNGHFLPAEGNGSARSESLELSASASLLLDKYCADGTNASLSTGDQRDSMEKLKELSKKAEFSWKFGTQNTMTTTVSSEFSQQGPSHHNHYRNNKVAYL